MKTIRNDYCIRLFTDKGNTKRAHMNEVNLRDGYLYATDASILAKINVDSCVKNYNEIEKYPNCESVILSHVSGESKTFSVDALFNDLMKIECCFKPKMETCDECSGNGTVECHCCGNEADCDACNGNGKVETDILELTSEYDCEVFNKNYSLKYLEIIIRAAIILGVKEITISNHETSMSSIFYVGDFTILLMQRMKNN